jgi:hypothetical protein
MEATGSLEKLKRKQFFSFDRRRRFRQAFEPVLSGGSMAAGVGGRDTAVMGMERPTSCQTCKQAPDCAVLPEVAIELKDRIQP